MRKLLLIISFQIIAITTFCQTVGYPTYSGTNMADHSITKVVISSYETVLYFTYKSHSQAYASNCGSFSCFNIGKDATIRTNTGQALRLIRCVNLYQTKGDDLYWASCYGGDFNYQLVFSKIDDNATSIDFAENQGSTTSYYMSGIDLKRNGNNNSSNNGVSQIMEAINHGISNGSNNTTQNTTQKEKATLLLYNNTDDDVYFAYAYYDNENSCWTSVGWYKIEKYKEFNLDLGNYSGHVYIHGKQNKMFGLSEVTWGKDNYLCINPSDAFTIRNADKINCDKKVGFADKVITGGVNKWSFNP